ncbi:hypothetical protein Droror1_Dr00026904 [Drosera rotundifolia]
MVEKLLQPVDEVLKEHKRRQLRELATLDGTLNFEMTKWSEDKFRTSPPLTFRLEIPSSDTNKSQTQTLNSHITQLQSQSRTLNQYCERRRRRHSFRRNTIGVLSGGFKAVMKMGFHALTEKRKEEKGSHLETERKQEIGKLP